MTYVDGFVIAMPKKNIPAYRKMASVAKKVWLEHGALDYKECVGDDMRAPFSLAFPKLTKLKPGEVVLFSFIVYKSRGHRDSVNKRVMKDPRIQCDEKDMPFNVKRMAYGGFKTLVE